MPFFKNLFVVLSLLFTIATLAQGGATSCAELEANPTLYQSCATSVPFGNQTTNSSDTVMPSCFGQPIKAPTWFFIKINQSGDITLEISQVNNAGAGIDVDFALWGPFPNLSNICNQLNNSTQVDCSWLPDSVEEVIINNVQVGEFYILMVDNFEQQPGEISIAQTGGTGSSDCSFLSSVSIKDTANNEITDLAYCKPATKELKAIVDITDFTANPANLRFNYRWSKDGVVINTLNNSLLNINSIIASQTGEYIIEIAAYDITDATIDITNIPFLPGQSDIIELEFIDPPVLNNLVLLQQCDFSTPNNDGITNVDLTQAYNNITNTTIGISLKYYLDVALTQEITTPENFTNTNAFNQTIYVSGRQENASINCPSNIATVNLQINPSSLTNYPNPSPKCPEANTNYAFFDFDAHKIFIKNTYFPFSNVAISFYLTTNDASIETNQVTNSNQIDTGITTIYVRVESNNNCSGIGLFSVEVIAPPTISNINPINACLSDAIILADKDTEILTGQNPSVQTSYFFTLNDALNNTNTIDKNNNLVIPSTGTTQLFIRLFDTITQCFSTSSFNLNVYQQPISLVLNPSEIIVFDEENTVTAIATPPSIDYEYQLNNNNWQETPVFSNLPIGENTIKVRNKNGCNELEQTIIVVDFPKFFTPNEDGINDKWIFTGKEALFETRIFIYDRYGKLVNEIDKNSGWDGKYNNDNLPSDDYWFKLF